MLSARRFALLIWLPLVLLAACVYQVSASGEARRPAVQPLPDNNLVTGFTTRYGGSNVYATAVSLAQASFPATSHANQPGAVILVRADRKAEVMAAVPLIHHPIDAPILFVDADRLPPETAAALDRFDIEGIAYDRKVQILAVGGVSGRVVAEVEEHGLKVRRIRGNGDDPASLAEAVDAYRATIHADHPDTVVVASLDAPEFAFPALSFAAHMPTGVAFVYRDSIPEATRRLLSNRFGPAYVYLMGAESAASGQVAADLAGYGHVQRLAAPDPYALSAFFAGFRDTGQDIGFWFGRKPRDFGWAIAEPGHNFTFANPDHWAETLAATVLSHRGKHAPMLLVQPDQMPEPVRRYLDGTVRPRPATPRDQLLNHGTIVGDVSTVSGRLQGEIDGLLRPLPAQAPTPAR